MPVMDEFKEERRAVKDAGFKERLKYFWYYNKWYVVGGIIALIIVSAFIHDMVSRKDIVYDAALLNCTANLEAMDEYNDRFLADMGIDTKKNTLSMDTSLKISFGVMDEIAITSAEKLSAYVAAAMLDTITAKDELFENYANAGIFADLRDVLSDEEIKKYEPYFYYVDEDVVRQVQLAETQMDSSIRPKIPDPDKPELMEEPVPVGIYIDDCSDFLNVYTFTEAEHVVVGILQKAPNTEMTLSFVNYIFEKQ